MLALYDFHGVPYWSGRYNDPMPDATFQCPTCEARYEVVRVEAPPTHDN